MPVPDLLSVHLALACAVLACGGCDRRAAIASCDDNLAGQYAFEGTRWAVLDHGATLEAVPMFSDVPAIAGLEVAPRWIDLSRTDAGIAGYVRRRYMRGSSICNAKLAVRFTACVDDAIDILIADPVPPIEFEPCTFPHADGNRRERWRRE